MRTDSIVTVETRVSVTAVVLTKVSVAVAVHTVGVGCGAAVRGAQVVPVVPTSAGISSKQSTS